MKNVFKRMVSLVIAIAMLIILVPETNVYAVAKPAKVTGTNVTRTGAKMIKVAWEKNLGVTGYQVYMKMGTNGSFKKQKTTSATSCTLKNLKLGESYYLKVRAYKKVKGKTVYGKFSSIAKIKMTEWVYLSDVMTPYAGGAYTMYRGVESFNMGGNQCRNGFSMDTDMNDVHDIYFNLNGQYKKMTFEWGCVDGREDNPTSSILIYEDDTLVDTLNRNQNDLPKTYELDVNDVYKLRIERTEGLSVGFANVKLYY